MAHVLLKKFLVFSIFFILVSVFVLNLDFSFASPPSTSSGQAPSDFGLKEGDLISAIFSDDPDVYIVNEYGYKRLFLNPEIFKFYSHLGGFTNVKLVTSEVRDSFPTAGLFRNCEDDDQRVFGIDVEGEDEGQLHWVNTTGDQAVKADPNFFKKVFCINKKEFNWYKKASEFNSITEVPKYDRVIEIAVVSTKERLESKAETKHIGKVAICHYPPENIKAYQTLTTAASALKAHLDHGDTVGVCLSPAPTPVSTSSPQATPSTSPGPTASPSASPISSASFSPTPVPTVTTTSTPVPTTDSAPPPVSSTPTPTPTPTSATTSLVATPGTNKVTLIWSGTAKRYLIHRSVNGGIYQPMFTADVPSYDDSYNLVSGSTYRYKVYDCDLVGSYCQSITGGIESNTVTYTGLTITPTPTPTAPPAPTSVTATLATGKITISWTGTSTQYLISRKYFYLGYDQGYQGPIAVTGFTFDDSLASNLFSANPLPGFPYRYKVSSCAVGGSPCPNGTESNLVSATPTPTPTPTPSPTPDYSTLPNNVSGVTGYSSNGKAYLTWTDNSSNETRFTIYRRSRTSNDPGATVISDWASITEVGASITTYTDSPTSSGYYEYRVGACNYSSTPDPIWGTIGCASNSGGPIITVSVPTPTPTPTPVASSVSYDNFSKDYSYIFDRDLYFGVKGNDVKQLQALLVNEVGYSANLVTGYFGNITRDAVKRLQEKYGVKPVLGYFGAITRGAIKVLISN